MHALCTAYPLLPAAPRRSQPRSQPLPRRCDCCAPRVYVGIRTGWVAALNAFCTDPQPQLTSSADTPARPHPPTILHIASSMVPAWSAAGGARLEPRSTPGALGVSANCAAKSHSVRATVCCVDDGAFGASPLTASSSSPAALQGENKEEIRL
jgi:hypothetical protein